MRDVATAPLKEDVYITLAPDVSYKQILERRKAEILKTNTLVTEDDYVDIDSVKGEISQKKSTNLVGTSPAEPHYSDLVTARSSATNGGRGDAAPLRNGEPLYAELPASTRAISMTNVQPSVRGISVPNVYVDPAGFDRDVQVL